MFKVLSLKMIPLLLTSQDNIMPLGEITIQYYNLEMKIIYLIYLRWL